MSITGRPMPSPFMVEKTAPMSDPDVIKHARSRDYLKGIMRSPETLDTGGFLEAITLQDLPDDEWSALSARTQKEARDAPFLDHVKWLVGVAKKGGAAGNGAKKLLMGLKTLVGDELK